MASDIVIIKGECTCDDTVVLNSRTINSVGRYKWIPVGVRVRDRECRVCGRKFRTYEGELLSLVKGYRKDIVSILRSMVKKRADR